MGEQANERTGQERQRAPVSSCLSEVFHVFIGNFFAFSERIYVVAIVSEIRRVFDPPHAAKMPELFVQFLGGELLPELWSYFGLVKSGTYFLPF